jgi:hypothetical protein
MFRVPFLSIPSLAKIFGIFFVARNTFCIGISNSKKFSVDGIPLISTIQRKIVTKKTSVQIFLPMKTENLQLYVLFHIFVEIANKLKLFLLRMTVT